VADPTEQNSLETWELGWYYRDDGILDESSWTERDRWFTGEARRRSVSVWNEIRERLASESFRIDVDSALWVDERFGGVPAPGPSGRRLPHAWSGGGEVGRRSNPASAQRRRQATGRVPHDLRFQGELKGET
jgi:hypothetical protein